MKCNIGYLEFPSKSNAKEYFRLIRDNHADGEPILGQSFDHMCELLACHPEASLKVGSGISGFRVNTDPVWGNTRHFEVVRTDGTHTDFSFLACIDGVREKAGKMMALRREIACQVLDFKHSQFSLGPVQCPFTGEDLSPRYCHVDHIAPHTFRFLADAWLRKIGITLDQVITPESRDNQFYPEMVDPDQATSWAFFHHRNAKLRLLSPAGNLSRPKIENKEAPQG